MGELKTMIKRGRHDRNQPGIFQAESPLEQRSVDELGLPQTVFRCQ
jgi:hypothetical protein